jgi:hypothetical protein
MEIDQEKKDRRIDPVGIDLALTVFGTSVTVLAFLHQYFSSRSNHESARVRQGLLLIRRELFRLQGALDNLVLILERVSHQNKDIDLSNASFSISATMLRLREEDYYRWLDVQDAMKHVDRRIYEMISEIRSLTLDYLNKYPHEPFDKSLTEEFDHLLLHMSEMNFVDFIGKVRILLQQLTHRMAEIGHMH